MQKTIKSVNANIREWQSSYGPMKSVSGFFDDGESWSINCKPGNEDKTKSALEALAGKPLEGYVVEPNIDKNTQQQRLFQGKPTWNLKAQQPQGGFRPGGGGGSRPESWSYSREGAEAKAREIAASVALQQAVLFANFPERGASRVKTTEMVCDDAKVFFKLLMDLSKPTEERK